MLQYIKKCKNIPDEINENGSINIMSLLLIIALVIIVMMGVCMFRLLFGANYKDNIENIKNDCNKNNRGVDKMNQQTSCYEIQRKCYKWWKKYFISCSGFSVEFKNNL